MREMMNDLSKRDIYCQPLHGRLVVFGQWQRLTVQERAALAQQKAALLAQADNEWRTPLPAWLNAIVLGEMMSGDLTQYGLFFLAVGGAPEDEQRLTQLGAALYRAFPLLASNVAWDGEQPEWCVSTRPAAYLPEEAGEYADDEAFIQAQLVRPHSVFQRGMLRIVTARCAGERRWGIWLHHLVADADFIRVLLPLAQRWLQDGEMAAPDFSFIQLQWRLGRTLALQHSRLQRFWRGQAALFAALTPWEETLPAVTPTTTGQTFDLPAGRGGATLVAQALAQALRQQGIGGPLLAVAPVTLRRGDGGAAASGCYINLIPLVLDAGCSAAEFESRRRSWLEHALLPQEEIAEAAGVNYRRALVMLNIIDRPATPPAFRHSPEQRSRKPITLTLTGIEQGGWRVALTTRLGEAFSQALGGALRRALGA